MTKLANYINMGLVLGMVVMAFAFVPVERAEAYTFTQFMRLGSTGIEVQELQKALNLTSCKVAAIGAGAPGFESTYFGPRTLAAVRCFQSANNLAVDGIVGPMTRAALNAITPGNTGNLPAGCLPGYLYSPLNGQRCVPGGTTGGNNGGNNGGLQGDSGSVDSYSLVSGLGNEEVGEDEEDVEVAGIEIEVSDGSDIEFTAIRLVFNEGTADQDFEDYADEVSVWLDGEEVGRTDADTFNDDNNWTATISLDDAIARRGDTVELIFAVSGVRNLDSNDEGETWTVDSTQVRFRDAQGATITEDPSVNATTFSFEAFATAADTEFKITQGEDDNEVNEAHVIDIDATEETEGVDLLSFNVEIKGRSDVNLDALPVRITVGGAQNNVDEMISGLSLWMDGDEVGTATMSDGIEDTDHTAVGTQETFLFDDLDLDLKAGDDYEFLVKVDIYGLTDTGDVAAGDTIYAELGEIQTDLSSFDAEDESGEDLADADVTGNVTGEASEVRDAAISVELVSATAVKTAGDASAVQSDSGLFTITFDVTAFDNDVYIDKTAPDATGSANGVGTESDLNTNPAPGLGGTLTCTIASTSGATEGTDGFLVEEDSTERFAITCDVRDGAVDLVDGFYDVALTELLYALTDADGDIGYNFNLEDFKTPQIFLDDNGA